MKIKIIGITNKRAPPPPQEKKTKFKSRYNNNNKKMLVFDYLWQKATKTKQTIGEVINQRTVIICNRYLSPTFSLTEYMFSICDFFVCPICRALFCS